MPKIAPISPYLEKQVLKWAWPWAIGLMSGPETEISATGGYRRILAADLAFEWRNGSLVNTMPASFGPLYTKSAVRGYGVWDKQSIDGRLLAYGGFDPQRAAFASHIPYPGNHVIFNPAAIDLRPLFDLLLNDFLTQSPLDSLPWVPSAQGKSAFD
jgi:hypothetical protein